MAAVPEVFNQPGAGFILLPKGIKFPPVEDGWQKPEKAHTFHEATAHRGNVGILAGNGFVGLDEELASLEDESFKVIYRSGSISKAGRRTKPYRKCYGTHFLCFVSANGDVWECNVFAGDPRFLIGNADNESLGEIWTGPRRRQVLDFIANEMKIDECRDICRMDECNSYLWRLKHPWGHDDFI